MPHVFIYESLTAHGQGQLETDPAHSFYIEGRAMRDALVEDFAALPGFTVSTWSDVTKDQIEAAWERELQRADAVVIIAPEIAGELEDTVRRVTSANVIHLGCDLEAIRLCSNKLELASHWQRHQIATPTTHPAMMWCAVALRFPVIVKPIDGAGSWQIHTCSSSESLAAIIMKLDPSKLIIQELVPGFAVSVAFLCGEEKLPLVPTTQELGHNFSYQGGVLPILKEHASRATKLAKHALSGIAGLRGWVGVDLILGEQEDGSEDYVIEVNPRLTTSYLGQRAVIQDNLAELWYRITHGEKGLNYRVSGSEVRFRADGVVESSEKHS